MPPAIEKPEIDRVGRFRSSETGLFVPDSYVRAPNVSTITYLERNVNSQKGFSQGLELARDELTLAAKWPRKGGGFDDLTSQAIVDGMIANAGASPVIAPQISGMVARQQRQAVSATIDITGRKTPRQKARDAIAMFNDSPNGVTDALETIMYRMCTYNRGCPVATVCITFDFDQWEEYGLIAHPIQRVNQKAENVYKYWLEVDWAKFGTPVPFLPHPFDLEGTGNAEWPYWYRVRVGERKFAWVLLHCSQIIPMTPGKSSRPGIGTSAVWMCLGYLAEQILVTDERVEKMLYSLTDGIILLGGVHDIKPNAIEQKIESGRASALEHGFSVAKGTTIITSPVDQVSVAQITLRQPSGIEFKELREWQEDVIAFVFGEPLTALVSRGGVGYGANAAMSSENASETGIGSNLSRLGNALGAIYPRVSVHVNRTNDRAQRMNIDTLAKFAQAANTLISVGVISAQQANAIIDRDILILPEDGEFTAEANAEDNGGDTTDENAQADNQTPQDTNSAPPTNKASQPPPKAGSAQQRSAQAAGEDDQRSFWIVDPTRALGYRLITSAELKQEIERVYPNAPTWEREWMYANLMKVSSLRSELETLSDSEGVEITDEDVDLAISRSRKRVNADVAELLNARKVEE